MADESLGLSIRIFLRDLFGSRVSATLELTAMQMNAAYESRLLDKDRIISDLREQVAQLSSKLDRYELVLLPLTSPAGSLFTPRRERPSSSEAPVSETAPSWQEYQRDWDRQQAAEAAAEKEHSSGISNERRQEEVV